MGGVMARCRVDVCQSDVGSCDEAKKQRHPWSSHELQAPIWFDLACDVRSDSVLFAVFTASSCTFLPCTTLSSCFSHAHIFNIFGMS